MLKNRLVYLGTLVLLGIFVLIHESPLTYMLLYAVLLLPALSFGALLLSMGKLTLTETLASDTTTKLEPVTYTLHVHNKGSIPCAYVTVQFEATLGVDITLQDDYFDVPAGGSYEAYAVLTGNYWGTYPVGVKHMRVYDFLGLFSLKQPHTRRQQLHVSPLVRPILPLAVKSLSKSDHAQYLFNPDEDYSNVSDIQPYKPSDGYKKIHWKASAKKNQLMSKQFGTNTQDYVDVLLDTTLMELPEYPTHEQQLQQLIKQDLLIEACVSVLSQVSKHSFIVNFAIPALETPAQGTFAHLYEMVDHVRFDQLGFERYLTDYHAQLAVNKNLVIIVQRLTPELIKAIRELAFAKHHVMAIYSEPSDTATALSLANSHQHISCYNYAELV